MCGEVVEFLAAEGIAREDGGPPIPSHHLLKSHGTAGGSGIERVQPVTEKLERYLDVVDRLIETLRESYFLRVEGDADYAVSQLRLELRRLLACAQHRYEIANNVLHAVLQMADPIFVAPREALVHATNVRDILRDMALQDRAFGRAVIRAEQAAALRPTRPRSWDNLDQVEQAIVSHLRLHPKSTRQTIQAAIPRFSPATVWRRLRGLRDEGVVESDRGSRTYGGRGDGKRVRRSSTRGTTRAGKNAGGSAPFVFRLSRAGEGLRPSASDA